MTYDACQAHQLQHYQGLNYDKPARLMHKFGTRFEDKRFVVFPLPVRMVCQVALQHELSPSDLGGHSAITSAAHARAEDIKQATDPAPEQTW